VSETVAALPDWPMPRSCPFSPPDAYRELREEPPVKVAVAGGEAWLVTQYEHVRQVLGDPARFSSLDTNPGFPIRIQLPPEPGIMSLVRLDGEEHAKLRRMVMSEFTVRRTRAMHADIEALIEGLLDELEAVGPGADLVERFTVRLPALVIARMLGVPQQDEFTFAEHSRTIVSSDSTPEQVYGAFVELSQYMDRLTTAKEQDPQEDLLSRLARDHVPTGELTHQQLVSLSRFLLVAGHETTAHQISLSVLSLLKDPALLAELQSDPALYKPAVEELLRYWSIAQDNQVRAAVQDVEVGGARIAKGDGVILAIPGANHDESVFPGAGTLDIQREARHHIAFGFGPHLCPGAPLARLELELCLRALFTRFPTLRLAVPDSELEFRHTGLVYGLEKLPVTW